MNSTRLKKLLKRLANQNTTEIEMSQIESAKQNSKNFEVLYNKYYTQIFTFILSRINEKEQTADITSQVFLKALVNIKNFSYEGVPFSSWLFRVAINECNQYFRQNKKLRTVVLDDEFSKLLIDEISDNSVENNYNKLEKCIKKLKVKEVQLLQLRFYESRSFQDVGYILSITENNAKVKLYRLLDKMRKIINELK